jgi:hypothetical protein
MMEYILEEVPFLPNIRATKNAGTNFWEIMHWQPILITSGLTLVTVTFFGISTLISTRGTTQALMPEIILEWVMRPHGIQIQTTSIFTVCG